MSHIDDLPGPAVSGLEPTMKTVQLAKGAERFIVRYDVGCESRVLDYLVELVNRAEVNFDWFDAAVLSNQIGKHLGDEMKSKK